MVKPIADSDFWSTRDEYAKSGLVDASSVKWELDNMTYVIVNPALIFRIYHEQYVR